MGPIRQALRHRDLRLLLAAGLVSMTGDWVLRIGLTYYVYVLTRSTLASALMLLTSFAPQIVLGSIAGVFVDRWDLRRTMVITDVLLALGCCPCSRCTGPVRCGSSTSSRPARAASSSSSPRRSRACCRT
jgi:Na+/melibiose symporter-like transporter